MNKPYSSNRNAKSQNIILGMLIASTIFLSGCATNSVTEQQQVINKDDPYEHFNRKMYFFNDRVDNYVAKPISDGYKWVTPQFVQTGVYNFFSNLKDINVVVNDVLQAKFAQSAHDTGRLALNTTMGLGGFVDVATPVGLEKNEEDFDQTLAVWGVPKGSFLVIPLLGPTTIRGIPGAIFDTAANPSSYVGMPVQLISLLNTRANAEGSLKFINEASLDPYVFTREAFLQWRHNLATDGKFEVSLDFDDELNDDGEPADKSPDGTTNNLKLLAPQNTEAK
ncbi:VacJ family lipoprotein [Methylobacter sp. S3L5C]|uniref:MlaA family lipoprotein n=1 Tax=Methylobacter sp. S3L5C TaxID=2839024 RepID=UPI001FADCA83|nr:VacJ family lipoprotein [Methylobacter sp. S3L5C]UOA07206.1 VacJ family lipoprotein [Methylobacter sp. S3L5C]